MEEKKKISRCKFCHPFMGKNHDEYHCVAGGWEDDKVKEVFEEECENCEKYKSKYIEYPIEVSAIDNKFKDDYSLHQCGMLVKIRPCGEEYGGKTYLGIYLGELPIGTFISHHPDTNVLTVSAHRNPGIFVPELKKIIYGCESWWGEIKDVSELKDISDKDIENVWYVQLLKSLS